jgi:polysaccharide biosynthesis transport protein
MSGKDESWNEADEASPVFGFHDFVALIRRRLKVLIVTVLVVVGATVAVCLALPNRYEGTSTIQLEPRAKKIVGIDAVIPDLKGDTPSIESEVEIVRSAAVLGRVIEVLGLRTDPEFNQPSLWDGVLGKLGFGAVAGVDSRSQSPGLKSRLDHFDGQFEPGAQAPWQDDIIIALASRLKVYRVRNTLLVNIEFSSKDPLKAAKIANTIAEVYIRLQLEAKQRANTQATMLLKDRVAGLRQALTEGEQRLERFKAANDIFDSEGHLLLERELSREMETLVKVRDETAKARAAYEQSRRLLLDGSAANALSDVLENPTVRLLQDGLAKALRRQAEAQTKYGPRHPAMESISADVAKAQNQLTAEINKIIKSLRGNYLVAEKRQRELEANLVKVKAAVVQHKSTETAYRELQREVEATRGLYETLLKRMKQVAETTSLQYADARVVQRASVPQSAVAPKRKKLVLMAFLGSLAFGFGLVFLLEFAQPGFVRQADIERSLDLAQIAAFPSLGDVDGDSPADELRAIRLMLAEPHSAFAESTRALRYELDVRRPHNGSRVVLVVSALPNEGKSLVASNLAHYMALSGYRTLLVDADLRRGKLSRALGLGGRPGLIEVLSRRIAPLDAVMVDKATGLGVLPACGSAALVERGPELLSSRSLPIVIQELKHHFDIIVMDAPPVMPVSDARLLATYADQIAFVMTWRRTPKDIVRRALKLFGRNQAKIAGVVVNRVDPDHLDQVEDVDSAGEPRLPAYSQKAA